MSEISAEELAWARESLADGATVLELAEATGKTPSEWNSILASLTADPAARGALEGLEMVVAEGYEAGLTDGEIAARVGFSPSWVRIIVDRLVARGAIVRRRRRRGPRADAARNQPILTAYEATGSYGEAAAACAVTRNTVAGVVRRARRRGELPARSRP